MDLNERKILVLMKDKLVNDIEPRNGIIEFLVRNHILNDDDIAPINRAADREERAKILLDILPNCGPSAYRVFVLSLEEQYPWLVKNMNDCTIANPSRPSVQSVIPHIPSTTVSREYENQQLKKALSDLQPNGYVVLHGMKGCGKSYLAAAVLSDSAFVETYFDKTLYWLKFGYRRLTNDDLLTQLGHLYYQIKKKDPPLLHAIEELQKNVETYFYRSNGKALLILDDVADANIIKIFNFPTKILVITTDVSLLSNILNQKVIRLSKGFHEAESLSLFAQVLDIPKDQLPEEAKKIHLACKGMPLLISIVAAQMKDFAEDMRVNKKRWQHYLDIICKQSKNGNTATIQGIKKYVFDIPINHLTREDKKRYQSLAIFNQDVNIMPETLCILWDEESIVNVENVMNGFYQKTLVDRQWNEDLKKYVFGVHDLLLNHLRNSMKHDELVRQHEDFITKCSIYCQNDFSKLPSDNYIYSYIGHHFEQAEKSHDDFKNLFLNFRFIESKLRNTTVTDLLIDLNKYRSKITNSVAELEANVDDIVNFLRHHAGVIALHRDRDCLDLVQIALNHTPGFCQSIAQSLAHDSSNTLYWYHERDMAYPLYGDTVSMEVPREVCCLNFTGDPNKVLIGSKNGTIICWNYTGRSSPQYFECGNDCEIIKIIVSRDDDFFLALTNTPTIKLFDLKLNSGCNTPDICQSPREKQESWLSSYPTNDDSKKNYSIVKSGVITDMALSSDDKVLAACTDKGHVVVWNIDGEVLWQWRSENKYDFRRLTFSKGSRYLHVIEKENGYLTIFHNVDGTFNYRRDSAWNPFWRQNKDMSQTSIGKIVQFQEILRDDEETRTFLLLVTEELALTIMLTPSASGTMIKPDGQYITDVTQSPFLAATLTHDGEYLITSDSDNMIKVWDTRGNLKPVSFIGRATALDTYLDNIGKPVHRIISGGKFTIQQRDFPQENVSQAIQRPLFDAVMRRLGQPDNVAQVMFGNKIGYYQDRDLVKQSVFVDGEILALTLNFDGSQVLYSTQKGAVYYWDCVTNNVFKIMTLTKPTRFLKFLKVHNATYVVCQEKHALKFWLGDYPEITILAGNIVAIFSVPKNFFITVASEGKLMIWRINNFEFSRIFSSSLPTEMNNGDDKRESSGSHHGCTITFCTMNHQKTVMASLKLPSLLCFDKIEYDNGEPVAIVAVNRGTLCFANELECCAFSPDDNLLAIGDNEGTVTILSVTSLKKYVVLAFHCSPVRQLHWAPPSLGQPILASVTCDEVAWWNLNDAYEGGIMPRRTGIPRRSGSPPLCARPRTIQSSPSLPANISRTSHEPDAGPPPPDPDQIYWGSRVVKHPKYRALLQCVAIPPTCQAKVCPSGDFKKFLLIDVHGSISYFKLFQPPVKGGGGGVSLDL